MELPNDILQIIKEYSMPITRPNWRSLRLMTSERFHLSVAQTINRTFPQSVFEMVQRNGLKYHLEYDNGLPYIEYLYIPNGTTTSGWPIYIPMYVPS